MRKKTLIGVLFVLTLCCGALGFSGAHAGTASAGWNDPDNWKGAPGYGDNTVVREGAGTCIVGQNRPDDFATSYIRESFYIDGFTAAFRIEKPQVDGNFKLIFTDAPGWYTSANAAFSVDFAQGGGNTLSSVTQNIKYPGGGNEIGSFKMGNRSPTFYWDGSRENVFTMYFKEDGLLYFSMNGVEFDSSPSGFDTRRLESLGILDCFVNGRAWVSLWAAQVKKPATVTFTQPFRTMDDPTFSDAAFDGWQIAEGGQVQSAYDGIRRLSFRSGEGSAFGMKRTSFNDTAGFTVSLMLGMERGKSATLFFDNTTAQTYGRQLRLRFTRADTDNVSVLLFDGTSESELMTFTVGLAISDPPSGDSAVLEGADLIAVELKRVVGDYYLLRLNGEPLPFSSEQSGRLGDFLSGNFADGAAVGFFTEAASRPTVVKTASLADLSSGEEVTDWADLSDSAVLGRDGSCVQICAKSDSGEYRVVNRERTFWLDRFGIDIRVQANRPDDRPSIRFILSNRQGGWYESVEGASAAVVEFVCDGSVTAVNLYSHREGAETLLASGTSEGFSWNYNDLNRVRFGMTADGWSVIVNEYPVPFAEDFQAEAAELAGDFSDSIAYLSIEGGGAPETSVTIEQYRSLIEGYSAPRGWGKGHYLVPPVWGEKGEDESAAFGTPGGGYTVEMTNSVPVTGFRMVLKATPGSVTSYATFALNSAHSDWYNTSNAIGFLLFSGPGQDLAKARFGLVVADAARGIQGVEVFSDIADFDWYRENTIEIRRYRGEYGFYVNDKKLFADSKNASDGNRGFHEYMTDLNEKFYLNRAKLQVFGDAGDMTFVVTEINEIEPKSPPSRVNSEKARLEEQTYYAGEEISIDLSKLYTSRDGLDLTFEASVGRIVGSVWRYTPAEPGILEVTFKCTDSEGQTGLVSDMKWTVGSRESDSGGCGGRATASGGLLLAACALLGGVSQVRRRR